MTDQMQRLVKLADDGKVNLSLRGNIWSIEFAVRGIKMTAQRNVGDPLIYAFRIAEWDVPIGALETLLEGGAS